MRKKGLTLVELLVVIGLILFITATFIFPAYERARGRATEVVCVSNLRQIGQALLMYAQDHDGLVPPYSNLIVTGHYPGQPDYIKDASPPKRWIRAFEPYVRDRRIFFCPVDPFVGLPPSQTPSQGLPERSESDFAYAYFVDHSISSYATILDEEWIAKGFHPTTDIYINMSTFPIQWLLEDVDELWELGPALMGLHSVAVYLYDYTHFLAENHWMRVARIELFYDGHVEICGKGGRKCSIWQMVKNWVYKSGGEER